MLSFKEYKTSIAEPAVEEMVKFAKECQEVKDNIYLADFHPNTPEVLVHEDPDDEENGGTAEIIEFYNLPIDNSQSKYYKMPVVDAILKFLDDLQKTLKLNKEFASIKNFKKYLLSLDRNNKIIPYNDFIYSIENREKIRENGVNFNNFFYYFTAIRHDIYDIKPKDISIVASPTAIIEPPIEVIDPSSEGLELDIEIKNSGIISNFVSNMTLENVVRYKNALVGAIKLINNSEIQGFKKVLSGAKFVIGTQSGIYDKTGFKYTGGAIAHHIGSRDLITYYTDKKGDSGSEDKNPIATIIHEFGHRFHYRFIINGYDNKMITSLWRQAKAGKKECYLRQLPKIGDPLENFRENWWTVRTSSDEYILTNIDEESGEYTFTNSRNQEKSFSKKELLNLISCPSTYGARNPEEFVAEMCTLITLNKVKPSQRELADMFIDIVAKNLR